MHALCFLVCLFSLCRNKSSDHKGEAGHYRWETKQVLLQLPYWIVLYSMPCNEWINMLSFQCLKGKDYFHMCASPLAFSCFDFNQCAGGKNKENRKYTQCFRWQTWYFGEAAFIKKIKIRQDITVVKFSLVNHFFKYFRRFLHYKQFKIFQIGLDTYFINILLLWYIIILLIFIRIYSNIVF